ncbi:glycosyltransferase [Candidatus Alkanophaga liquidiphilum]
MRINAGRGWALNFDAESSCEEFLGSPNTPLLAFLIIVYTKAWRINRDLHDAFANGQYLLFSRGVYEAIGRHEAVRDMLVEDYALAQLVRKHGYKLRFYWAPETLKVQMYRNFTELWEGWIKNIYLGIGNPSSAALAITEIIILGVAPFIITLYGVITTNLGITLLGALHQSSCSVRAS